MSVLRCLWVPIEHLSPSRRIFWQEAGQRLHLRRVWGCYKPVRKAANDERVRSAAETAVARFVREKTLVGAAHTVTSSSRGAKMMSE